MFMGGCYYGMLLKRELCYYKYIVVSSIMKFIFNGLTTITDSDIVMDAEN